MICVVLSCTKSSWDSSNLAKGKKPTPSMIRSRRDCLP